MFGLEKGQGVPHTTASDAEIHMECVVCGLVVNFGEPVPRGGSGDVPCVSEEEVR